MQTLLAKFHLNTVPSCAFIYHLYMLGQSGLPTHTQILMWLREKESIMGVDIPIIPIIDLPTQSNAQAGFFFFTPYRGDRYVIKLPRHRLPLRKRSRIPVLFKSSLKSISNLVQEARSQHHKIVDGIRHIETYLGSE